MKKILLSGAIILNEKNELLLIHRNTNEKCEWELPGGRIEEGEMSSDSAIRSLKEELNIDISIKEFIDNSIFIDNNYMYEYYWYIAKIKSGILNLNESKYDDYRYFDQDLLLSKNDLSSNTKVLIRDKNLKYYRY